MKTFFDSNFPDYQTLASCLDLVVVEEKNKLESLRSVERNLLQKMFQSENYNDAIEKMHDYETIIHPIVQERKKLVAEITKLENTFASSIIEEKITIAMYS
jgi:hypothetical protein